jgi:hypothetical protein
MRVTASAVSGIILLILGVVLLLSNILGIKINFFRLFPGVILVILGIVVLFGQFGSHHEAIFDRKKMDMNEPFGEKNIIFAEGIIDLNDIIELQSSKKLKVNVIFGSGRLILNPEIPSVVHASSVFANLELPQHSVSFIGSTEYRSGDIQADKPFLDIEANVIFGQMKVMKPEQ